MVIICTSTNIFSLFLSIIIFTWSFSTNMCINIYNIYYSLNNLILILPLCLSSSHTDKTTQLIHHQRTSKIMKRNALTHLEAPSLHIAETLTCDTVGKLLKNRLDKRHRQTCLPHILLVCVALRKNVIVLFSNTLTRLKFQFNIFNKYRMMVLSSPSIKSSARISSKNAIASSISRASC